MKLILIITLVTLLTAPSFAREANRKNSCYEHESTRVITQFIKIRVGTGKAPWRRCDPAGRFFQLMEALYAMDWMEWDRDTVAPKPYNQGILGYNWYSTVLNSVGKIGFGSERHCEGADAYAYYRGNMYMCKGFYSVPSESSTGNDDLYFHGNPGVVTRISILLHEYRHVVKDTPHVKCPRNTDCDPSVSYLGGYTASMEAYAKMAVSARNLHPAQSSFASRMAYVTAVDRFRKKPRVENIEGHRVVLLQSERGEILVFDPRVGLTRITDKIFDGDFMSLSPGISPRLLYIAKQRLHDRFEVYSPFQFDWGRVAYKTFNSTDAANKEVISVSDLPDFLQPDLIMQQPELPSFYFFGFDFAKLTSGDLGRVELWYIVRNGRLFVSGTEKGRDGSIDRKFDFEIPIPGGERAQSIRSGLVQGDEADGVGYIITASGRTFRLKLDYKKPLADPASVGLELFADPLTQYRDVLSLQWDTSQSPFTHIRYYLTEDGELYFQKPGETLQQTRELQQARFRRILGLTYYDKEIPDALPPRVTWKNY